MRHRTAIALVAACALLLALAPATPAAISGHLKLGGADGEAHEMAIRSFSWDGVQRSGGGSRRASRVSRGAMRIMKQIDKSTPLLAVAAASGQRFRCAVLTLREGGERPFTRLRITLEDVGISRYAMAGEAGGTPPTDTFDLRFGRMEMSVASQDEAGEPDGRTTAGWDFLTHVPFESRGCGA